MNLNLRPKEECQFDAVREESVQQETSVHGKAAESTTLSADLEDVSV